MDELASEPELHSLEEVRAGLAWALGLDLT